MGQQGDYIFIAAQSNKPGSNINLLVYEDGKLLENISKTGDYPIVLSSGTI
jgi:hypothetical protein